MKRPNSVRVMIADDHPVVREGLRAILDSEPDIKVVVEARNGEEAVQGFFDCQPDVSLIDLRMPQKDGIEVIEEIRGKVPDAKFIVLTTYGGDEDIYRGVRAGASAYLLKECTRQELLDCIRSVQDGKRWLPPEVAAKLAARLTVPELTSREMEVLGLMAAGKSNKEIAAHLNIVEGTVKVHVTNVMRKLGVSSRAEAISTAYKRGIVHVKLP